MNLKQLTQHNLFTTNRLRQRAVYTLWNVTAHERKSICATYSTRNVWLYLRKQGYLYQVTKTPGVTYPVRIIKSYASWQLLLGAGFADGDQIYYDVVTNEKNDKNEPIALHYCLQKHLIMQRQTE